MTSFDVVRREIVVHRSPARKLAGALMVIALAALLRWVVDAGTSGASFTTFWPAVLLATVFLDWRYGLLTALGSAAIALWVFIPREAAAAGSIRLIVILPFFVFGIAIMIGMGHLLRSTVIELDRRVRQSDAFNEELQHRAKNALQMIRALASRAAQATDPVEFYETLASRLDALAQANELLRFGVLDSCELEELIGIALRPFPATQIRCSGPACGVVKEAVTPLTMAIHELGTNASKYGALSCATGSVSLSWHVVADHLIGLEWIETGGPPVVRPRRFGVGTRLLQSHGPLRSIEVDYAPEGVRCTIQIEGGCPQPEAPARNRAKASARPIKGSKAAISGP